MSVLGTRAAKSNSLRGILCPLVKESNEDHTLTLRCPLRPR